MTFGLNTHYSYGVDRFLGVNCGDVPEQCTANNTEYLDEAECECPEGYITTGNTTRVCQADGDWSDKNYNCTGECFV